MYDVHLQIVGGSQLPKGVPESISLLALPGQGAVINTPGGQFVVEHIVYDDSPSNHVRVLAQVRPNLTKR